MDKNKSKTWWIIIGAVVILAIGSYIKMSNDLNNAKLAVDAQWSQVENVMQRRADLIPNLTSSVQGSMKHEDKVFGEIAKARSNFNNAKTPNAKLKANDELNDKTTVLVNAIYENYPKLTSNKNINSLMTELEGTENRISVERRRYIQDVNAYNQRVYNFPTNMVASSKGMYPIQNYKATSSAQKVPKVKLDE